jgi:hypothetical protein
MNIVPLVFISFALGKLFYDNKPLAIKASNIEAYKEDSSQSLAIKKMYERYQDLYNEISREASFCLVGGNQNTESLVKLREYLDDVSCFLQRTKGVDPDFYELLKKQYSKDAQMLERLFNQAGVQEFRPENLPRVLTWYARKNNILNVRDYVAIGNHAKNDESLSIDERRGMRDVINFMKNPISRETFNCFSISRLEVDGIEFLQLQIESLQNLSIKAQNELNFALLEQKESIIDIE